MSTSEYIGLMVQRLVAAASTVLLYTYVTRYDVIPLPARDRKILSAQMRSRVYVTVTCPSVCLFHRAAGEFAAERRAGRRYRSLSAGVLP